MRYLSSKEIITVHELLIDRFGGMRDINEVGFGRLDGAVATPQISAFGEYVFPDLPSQAAALCDALVHAHPFSDGNKRIGLVALDLVLAYNDHTLVATNDEVYAVIMQLAQRQLSRDALTEWVQTHAVPRAAFVAEPSDDLPTP